MPQLSLIMPFKNAAAFIEETIRSIQQQDFKDWELLAINDHSSDASPLLVKAAAESDPRIKLRLNSGSGIIEALQTAANEGVRNYVSRMDADDLMPAGRLQKMIQALEQSPSGTIVTGLVKYFASGEVSSGYRNYERWLNRVNSQGLQWQKVYRECVIASPNWLIRSHDFKQAGGFEGLEYPEDYDLVFRWYQHNFNIKCLPETTLHWREHPLRTSRLSKHYQQESFFKLKIKRFVEMELKPKDELLLWGIGRKGKLSARLLQNLDQAFRWVAVQPQRYPQGLYQHKVESFKIVQNMAQVKILVAVYPPPAQRKKLVAYLQDVGLEEGRHWWFL